MKNKDSKLTFTKNKFVVLPHQKIKLKKYNPAYTGNVNKQEVEDFLTSSVNKLSEIQDKLYAQDKYAILIIFQAMDAAGKDSTIKHVMTGINPQGCQVYSFKEPSKEELDHDFLWRASKALPEKGRIGIFNRSYYEEVLIVKVHPELLEFQNLPKEIINKHIWDNRYETINNFEKHLVNNGVHILKFFLNVSKEEQNKRFLERIQFPEKNWKFSLKDVEERNHWNAYQSAYEDLLNNTSTLDAPWHIIPADNKWFTKVAVAHFIAEKMESLNINYPVLSKDKLKELQKAKKLLLGEK